MPSTPFRRASERGTEQGGRDAKSRSASRSFRPGKRMPRSKRLVASKEPPAPKTVAHLWSVYAARAEPPRHQPLAAVPGPTGVIRGHKETPSLSFTPAETEALLLSLKVSAVAVICALPFAVIAAALLANRQFRGKTSGGRHPPSAAGAAAGGAWISPAADVRNPRASWVRGCYITSVIRFVFSWTGAALAAAILTFPFQVRAIRSAIEAADPGLNDAAATLGAGAFDRQSI